MTESDHPQSATPTIGGEAERPSQERTIAGDGASSKSGSSSLQRGDLVGRYVVLQMLGRGGMGVVYTAYDPKLDRKVALKLRRPAVSEGDTAHLRLQREAQAIAQLSHPNVVSVHDVGTVGDRVFIAMELVDGLDLSHWLTAEERTTAQIVACFVQAGRGLAAAHAQGLVHRDFKPDNVLVGHDGRARVVDFGLVRNARWSDTSVHQRTAPDLDAEAAHEVSGVDLTTAGALLGTPAYMSPEQFAGQPGQARSDQFSFCVALYEALYNERPFVGDTIAALSTAVLAGKLREPASGTRLPRIRRVLGKGLAVEPTERYRDMDTLLAALERAAAPSRARYWWLGAATVVGAAATTWAIADANDRACAPLVQRAANAWSPARQEAIEARFLATDRSFAADTWSRVDSGITEYVGHWSELQAEVCETTPDSATQEFVIGAQECLDERLRSAAILLEILDEADLSTVTRSVSMVRGLADLDACTDADRLRERMVPSDPDLRTRVQDVRDDLTRVKLLHEHGDDGRASELLKTVAEQVESIEYLPLQAEVTVLQGELVSSGGDLDGSLEIYDRAFEQALASRHDTVAFEACAAALYIHGVERRERREAFRWARLAEAIAHRMGDPERLLLRVQSTRASVVAQAGDYDEAMKMHVELIERAKQADRPNVLSALQNNLGSVNAKLGNYEEARRFFEDSLAYPESIYGPDHPTVLRSQINLGITMILGGDAEEGTAFLEEVLPRQEAALGADHPEVANTFEALGVVYLKLGDYALSEAHRRRALQLREQSFGPNAVPVLFSQLNIAVLLRTMGRFDEMNTVVTQMMAAARHRDDPLPADGFARMLAVAIDNALVQEQGDKALQLATELRDLCQDNTGCPAYERRLAPLYVGRAQYASGDGEGAIATLREALEETDDLDENDRSQARFALGRALVESPAEHDAGRALIEQARVDVQDLGLTGKAQRERIDAWLEQDRGQHPDQ